MRKRQWVWRLPEGQTDEIVPPSPEPDESAQHDVAAGALVSDTTGKDEAMQTKDSKPRCYFCARPVERLSAQRVQVCGYCPDSAIWQAIWRQQHRES